ncbi:hypothetical protein B0H14DRAFT_3042162, partial [Mycena olivaceomarginata]
MSCPPPPAPRFRYAAMPLSADTSCTATPFRPTFVASVSISSLALHIRLHHLSCRFPCFPRAMLLNWIRRCWASWIRIPSRPPSFSSSRRRHGQHRSWVSAGGGVSPRLPVASLYSRRARDPRTIPQSDYIRHRAPYDLQMGISFDDRALPTARASANLAAFPYLLTMLRGYAREDPKGRGEGSALSERDWSKRVRF